MKIIHRNTEVISVSLPKPVAQRLEEARKLRGQSRSAFVASLIDQMAEEQRWQNIYKKGTQTAKVMGVTSEEDIDRILHGQSA